MPGLSVGNGMPILEGEVFRWELNYPHSTWHLALGLRWHLRHSFPMMECLGLSPGFTPHSGLCSWKAGEAAGDAVTHRSDRVKFQGAGFGLSHPWWL